MTRTAAPTEATPAVPRRSSIGLLDQAPAGGGRAGRWEPGGISYRPYSLPYDNTAGSFDPCADPNATIAFPDETEVDFPSFPIFATEGCPVIGADRSEVAARAATKLRTHRSNIIERVLWTGNLQSGDAYTDIAADDTARALPTTGYTAITGAIDTATDVVPAFAAIYQWASENAGDLALQIHAPARLVPYLLFYGLAHREGSNILMDMVDHRLVIGSGYDDSTVPTAAAAIGTDEVFVYVTTPISVWVTDPVVLPGNDFIVDRTNNRVEAIATAQALFEWDLNVHAAIRVGIPNPGPGIA